MLGVLYPLIYEFIYDQKISVGAPFYNAIFVPITLIACIFLYFSIDSKWQQSFNFKSLYQPLFLSISASSIIVTLACLYFSIGGIGSFGGSPFSEISKRLYSRIDPQKPLSPLIIRPNNLTLDL